MTNREISWVGQSASVTSGNIVSITVLASREIDLKVSITTFLITRHISTIQLRLSKASFVNILICLAAYDTIFELLAFLMYALPQHSRYYEVTSLHQKWLEEIQFTK